MIQTIQIGILRMQNVNPSKKVSSFQMDTMLLHMVSAFNITNDKIKDCVKAAKQTNSIILYKGSDTVIGTPAGEVYLNYLSSPYLATAGSGDVLAGLIGGLLAQKYEEVKATKLACYIHAQCGIKLGKGLIASDLIMEIPNVLKKFL